MNEIQEARLIGEQRSSNIELLRILMMLSLIAHHFTVNSGIIELFDFDNITKNMIFLQIFGMWGKTAINIFTLITGYFMVKSNMTWKRLLKLILEGYFYVLAFYIIFLLTGYETFSIKQLVKTILFLPLEMGSLYVGSMIAMMIFIPFVNILINALDKRQYLILVALLLLYFTGLSTFLNHETFNFVFWMLTMYLIGGYIRLYPCKWDKLSIGILGTVTSIIFMVASIVIIDFVGIKLGFESYYYMVSNANKFLAVTALVSIFIMFKNWEIGYRKLINVIASATFGVLLIHANSETMRKFLWRDIFDNAGHYQDVGLPIYACVVVLVVYVIAVIIDLLRMKFVERPFFKWLDKNDWMHKPLW